MATDNLSLSVQVSSLPEPITVALKSLQKAAYRHGWVSGGDGDAPDSAAEFRYAVSVIAAALRPASGAADGLAVIEAKLRMYGAAERSFARAEERGEIAEAERADRHGHRLQREILDAVARLPAPAGAASGAVGSGYAIHSGPDGVRLMSNHGDDAPDWTLALVGEAEDEETRKAQIEEIRRDLAKGEVR